MASIIYVIIYTISVCICFYDWLTYIANPVQVLVSLVFVSYLRTIVLVIKNSVPIIIRITSISLPVFIKI